MKEINLSDTSLSLSAFIGGLLREIRLQNGQSGCDVAALVNLSQQQVSRYERGKTGFQMDVLFRFFSALNMSADEIRYFFYQVIRKSYDGCRPCYVEDISSASSFADIF